MTNSLGSSGANDQILSRSLTPLPAYSSVGKASTPGFAASR